jgi:hypothetical protein
MNFVRCYVRSRSFFLVLCLLTFASARSGRAAETVSQERLSLNGIWEFLPDGKEPAHEIRVPSFWDAPQDYGYPAEWLHLRHGIYRKQVRLPASMHGKEIFLQIRRVSVIAKVTINGHQVGAEDSGGYLMLQLPYLIDITPHLKLEEENLIEVAVWGGKSMIHGSDSQDNLMKEDDFPPDTKSEGRFLFPWCVDHWDGRRGLNGDVSLVATPKLRVSDVFVVPDLHKNSNPLDDEITLKVSVMNHDTGTRKVQVRNRALLPGIGPRKAFDPLTVTLAPKSSLEVAIPNVPWPDAEYWWPHNPRLYVLQTELIEDGETIDTCHTRFGFRQFYVNGPHYELNGIRANLRGDAYEFSWHEGFRHGPATAPVFSTKELVPKIQHRLVREYQKLNHNMLRPHKASAIDELYDACDEIGMMVLDEAPFWQTWIRTDERARPNFEAWVRRWVRERRNHPSIVAWVAANECWKGPIPLYSIQAVRATDPSRPVFHDDPRGPIQHNDPGEVYAGDEDCRHYTGGYPIKALNAEALYDIYRVNTEKPTGEGESLFADGWPLMNADGTLSGKNSQRGEFGNPDMISQGQWVRGVCRMLRAMRYAGLSDSRLYASWMYAFDPIETDLQPVWTDLTAPGIKPVILHRPIINVFSDDYADVRYSNAYEYYRDSFSPVAVFDKEADRQNRIGVPPPTFNPADSLSRTLVVYNDEFSGGTEVVVTMTLEAWDPHSGSSELLGHGSVTLNVPYGEKREREIRFLLPGKVQQAHWLLLTLAGSKDGAERFRETSRLGALVKPPGSKLTLLTRSIDLGEITTTNALQWHLVRLANYGGGFSEKWSLAGADPSLHFNLTSGNLRGEQEIYFQVKPEGISAGQHECKVRFTGEGGTSAELSIRFCKQ